MRHDPERLQRLLGGPELEPLRRRLRQRYQQGRTGDHFTLQGLSGVERQALEGLLGRPAKAAASMRLSRAELDTALARAGVAENLHAALELLDGPLEDLKARRIALQREWRRVVADAADPRLRAAVADPVGLAVLKRLAGSEPRRAVTLLANAERVLAQLPARGLPLAHLAAGVLGDAHALDAGQPVATLVLRAFRRDMGESVPGDPGLSFRDQWAALGVSVNELAAPVLCLNVPADEGTPAGALAARAKMLGEPVHLSLRTLLRDPPSWHVAGLRVFVCENASIVAIAADRLGTRCAPLVCTDGMPGAAQQTLLRQLAACGAQLHYHGDFDWPGLQIGNFVMREFGALPWRYGSEDYDSAPAMGRALEGDRTVVASWERELSGVMAKRGLAIHEEAVDTGLLADLEGAPDDTSPSDLNQRGS